MRILSPRNTVSIALALGSLYAGNALGAEPAHCEFYMDGPAREDCRERYFNEQARSSDALEDFVNGLGTKASSSDGSYGAPSAGAPSAGAPSAGTPSAGTPSAGTPSAGTPSAGMPSPSTPPGAVTPTPSDGPSIANAAKGIFGEVLSGGVCENSFTQKVEDAMVARKDSECRDIDMIQTLDQVVQSNPFRFENLDNICTGDVLNLPSLPPLSVSTINGKAGDACSLAASLVTSGSIGSGKVQWLDMANKAMDIIDPMNETYGSEFLDVVDGILQQPQ